MLFAFGKQFFCEQPSVDAFKVKIKEDGEHLSESCRFPFLLNNDIALSYLHLENNFFCEQPSVDAFKVKIKEDGAYF